MEFNALTGGAIGQIACRRSVSSIGGNGSSGLNDTWFHFDHIGNVVNTSNSSGVLAEAFDQDAWGNVLSSVETGAWASTFDGRHLYGQVFDPDAGLYSLPGRPFDPRIGRFIRPGSPYTLGGNNPFQMPPVIPPPGTYPPGDWVPCIEDCMAAGGGLYECEYICSGPIVGGPPSSPTPTPSPTPNACAQSAAALFGLNLSITHGKNWGHMMYLEACSAYCDKNCGSCSRTLGACVNACTLAADRDLYKRDFPF